MVCGGLDERRDKEDKSDNGKMANGGNDMVVDDNAEDDENVDDNSDEINGEESMEVNDNADDEDGAEENIEDDNDEEDNGETDENGDNDTDGEHKDVENKNGDDENADDGDGPVVENYASHPPKRHKKTLRTSSYAVRMFGRTWDRPDDDVSPTAIGPRTGVQQRDGAHTQDIYTQEFTVWMDDNVVIDPVAGSGEEDADLWRPADNRYCMCAADGTV